MVLRRERKGKFLTDEHKNIVVRRGNPLHAHDANVRYGTYKSYITQNRGFVSQAGRGLSPPATQNLDTNLLYTAESGHLCQVKIGQTSPVDYD